MSNKSDSTTLIVAIDGSKHSERVVDSACDLGKKLSAKIVLLFVSPYKEIEKEYENYAQVEYVIGLDQSQQIAKNVSALGMDEYYRVVGDALLSHLAAKVKGEGLACESLFEVGNPAARITDIAKERKAEMIIIGLHGLHGIARLRTLGSVSRRVLENSTCPVVVVP